MKHRASSGCYSFDLVIHRHGVWAKVAATINLITEKDEVVEVVDSCYDIAVAITMAAAMLSVFFTFQLSQLAQS